MLDTLSPDSIEYGKELARLEEEQNQIEAEWAPKIITAVSVTETAMNLGADGMVIWEQLEDAFVCQASDHEEETVTELLNTALKQELPSLHAERVAMRESRKERAA